MRTTILVLVIGVVVHGSIYGAAGPKKNLSLAWGASSRMGLRPTMEDFYSVEGTAFGVFDGHRGSFAAKYAATHLLPKLQAAQGMSHYSEVFREMDQQIEAQDTSGTTATIAIIKEGWHGYSLYLARVGDSYSKCGSDRDPVYKIPSGDAHGPESVKEQERIKRAGGNVYLDHKKCVARVTCPDASILGLCVTRALGDRAWPNTIISPEPYLNGHPIDPKDKFLVIASHGVWNYLDANLAEFIVKQTLEDDIGVPNLADEQDQEPSKEGGNDHRAIRAARVLCNAAYARGSDDNITAMVINFVWSDDPAQPAAR